MLQRYHLALRTPDGTILVDDRAHGWLLPAVAADVRERAPFAVARLVERLDVDGFLACVTSGIVDPQQDGIDWLAIVDIRCERPSGFRDRSIQDLLHRRSLVSVQADLLRAYEDLAVSRDSALSREQLARIEAWTTARSPAGRTPVRIIPHRAELFEAVWEVRSERAAASYLKWRTRAPFVDRDVAEIVGRSATARVP